MKTFIVTLLVTAGLLASDVKVADPEVPYPAHIERDGSVTFLHLVVRSTKSDKERTR